MKFYAVVYGNSWEDIDYFSDFQTACHKLILQTREMSSVHPMMFEYSTSEEDAYGKGTYGRAKPVYGITKREELDRFDIAALKRTPACAMHLVETIF